jgi:hypothetical protein
MDANFFELWGRSLLNVAKGQQQMDEFNRWMNGGLGASDSLLALFRRIYGLDKVEKGGDEYLKLYEKAMQSSPFISPSMIIFVFLT